MRCTPATRGGFKVLSAGLNNDAEVPITSELVEWADTIFVMEKAQKINCKKKIQEIHKQTKGICLDIPDDYEYMQSELLEILEQKPGNFFKRK